MAAVQLVNQLLQLSPRAIKEPLTECGRHAAKALTRRAFSHPALRQPRPLASRN
jgi:hypothetical protein